MSAILFKDMFPDLDPDDNVLLDIPPAETAAATRKTKKNVKLTLTLWSKDDISFVCINTQPHVKRFKTNCRNIAWCRIKRRNLFFI